jgi:hypothetical protein
VRNYNQGQFLANPASRKIGLPANRYPWDLPPPSRLREIEIEREGEKSNQYVYEKWCVGTYIYMYV